ncbi:MAG: pyruvate kinase [Planctomycetes bacterium]|nr:pyruvate kinase [Planctomycetota bacterium]
MSTRFSIERIQPLIDAVIGLRDELLTFEAVHGDAVERVHPEHRPSARNLLHYLALRNRDLRPIQAELSSIGLSSLGRAESAVLQNLDAVLAALHHLVALPVPSMLELPPPVGLESSRRLLGRHADALLGPAPSGRDGRIMVTLPSEAATDPGVVRDLIAAGMDCARINSAHDGRAAWERMAEHVRAAADALDRPCRILFDLGGPKLRTTPVLGESPVIRFRPERDRRGHAIRPARVLLCTAELTPPAELAAEADAIVPVDAAITSRAIPGDLIEFHDTRKRHRELLIVERSSPASLWAEAWRGCWLEEGSAVRLKREQEVVAESRLGRLPEREDPLLLAPGDRLRVAGGVVPGHHEERGPGDGVIHPNRIGSTLGDAIADVQPGESIWFDDGRIGGVVEAIVDGELLVRIDHAPPDGARLRGGKGINLPDSELRVPRLTEQDRTDLEFALQRADLVGMSFVDDPAVVRELVELLEARGGGHLGIVLKIETRRAFEQLPHLLLEGLTSPPVGVMVARGDLAVEVGFARLAEVQEEILWLCEAAHVPVVWATQVLETLAKKGQPSRAEVSDAAMGGRAECVMLNKGPFVTDAVRFLDDVLRRMRAHQDKKRAMLRQLRVSRIDEAAARRRAARRNPDRPSA